MTLKIKEARKVMAEDSRIRGMGEIEKVREGGGHKEEGEREGDRNR